MTTAKRNTVDGIIEVCCHQVEWWYDMDDLKLTDEIKERLEKEAEDRAKSQINEGMVCGELNCLYHGDEAPGGVEIRGAWEIKRD